MQSEDHEADIRQALLRARLKDIPPRDIYEAYVEYYREQEHPAPHDAAKLETAQYFGAMNYFPGK
jgi:hypothetical protein